LPVADAKTLVLRYVETVWNRGDLTALDDLTTPTFTYHLAGRPGLDRAGMGQFLAGTRVAFPDWRVQVKEVIAEDGAVAVRWEAEATHRGPFHGVPPTGRTIRVSGINFYRLEDGKVASEWEQMDSLGMLQQLGVLPA
jgi:steroid delta-isomerase-like uncharacterized protein